MKLMFRRAVSNAIMVYANRPGIDFETTRHNWTLINIVQYASSLRMKADCTGHVAWSVLSCFWCQQIPQRHKLLHLKDINEVTQKGHTHETQAPKEYMSHKQWQNMNDET